MKDSSGSISVRGLRKTYVVHEREAGMVAALRSLAHRRARMVTAVDDITFDVQPGEVVGFLGPNGAGKTTTLKVLSGLLFPTAGSVSVLGHVPWRREKAFLRQITLVMGQRNPAPRHTRPGRPLTHSHAALVADVAQTVEVS
jgi:ABC-2 type transport system ATP-binding protein